MDRAHASAVVAALALAWPLRAAAQDAYTLAPVDVYAGPGIDYPRVATLSQGAPVHVDGCLADWAWCDVRFANDRGWVDAAALGYPYRGDRVAIFDYGPLLGIPRVEASSRGSNGALPGGER
ncbi:MAG TPA: SH3 domain-containing protein [Casimicrobiaceae bacterium]